MNPILQNLVHYLTNNCVLGERSLQVTTHDVISVVRRLIAATEAQNAILRSPSCRIDEMTDTLTHGGSRWNRRWSNQHSECDVLCRGEWIATFGREKADRE